MIILRKLKAAAAAVALVVATAGMALRARGRIRAGNHAPLDVRLGRYTFGVLAAAWALAPPDLPLSRCGLRHPASALRRRRLT